MLHLQLLRAVACFAQLLVHPSLIAMIFTLMLTQYIFSKYYRFLQHKTFLIHFLYKENSLQSVKDLPIKHKNQRQAYILTWLIFIHLTY